jgi:thiol-disulfide isomerase/thioredoxin
MTLRFTLLLALILLFSAPPASALEVGSIAPDFELSTLEGKSVRLSDYKGRIIILKLATTWCPTCKEQSAELLDASDFLQRRDIPLIDVFLQDSDAMVREYLRHFSYRNTYVALQDDGSARRNYHVYLIPRVLVIDRDFKVHRDGNMITASALQRSISQIAAKN